MKAYIVCIGETPISCQLLDYKSALNWQHNFENSVSNNPLTETYYKIKQIKCDSDKQIAICNLKGEITSVL